MRIFPPFFVFLKSQPRAPFDIVTDETHIQNSMYTYFKTKQKHIFSFLSIQFTSYISCSGNTNTNQKKKSQFTTASIYNIKFTHPFVSRGDLLLGKLRDLLWKTGGNKKTRSAPIESHTYWKVHFIFKW